MSNRPLEPEVSEVVPRPGQIDEHGSVGVPAMVYPYSAGIVGGLLGGLAMVVVALIYGFLSGKGPWYPVNLIGATLLRNLQNAPPEVFQQFNLAALISGLGIHLVISVTLGLLFALVLPTLPGTPYLWAIIVGPLLWLSATLVALPLLNPVMQTYVDWPSFAIAHIAYSLVLGWWVARTPKVPARHGGSP